MGIGRIVQCGHTAACFWVMLAEASNPLEEHGTLGTGELMGGDADCWAGELTWGNCCRWDPDLGAGGNPACWAGDYTYERCCGADCALLPHKCKHPVQDEVVDLAIRTAQNLGYVELANIVQRLGFMSQMLYMEGISPVASFIEHYARRQRGVPGYGAPGAAAEAFRWLICYGGFPMTGGCDFTEKQLSVSESDYAHNALNTLIRFQESLHGRGNLVFRLALQIFDVCIGGQSGCPPRLGVARLLAGEMEEHEDQLAQTIQELRGIGKDPIAASTEEQPKQIMSGTLLSSARTTLSVYVPRLGTFSNIFLIRAASDQLMEQWMRTVEAWVATDSMNFLFGELITLAHTITHAATFLMAHAFAHFYVTVLWKQGRRASAVASDATHSGADIGVAVHGPKLPAILSVGIVRFIFHPVCCFRSNVLLELLSGLDRPRLYIAEVGVHVAHTAEWLLDHLPHLWWVGVDAYSEASGEDSGEAMFAKAQERLSRFGERARLVREWSSVAWNASGTVIGIEQSSLDLVFVDGDHEAQSVRADLEWWSRLVRIDGLVAGHDLFNPVNDGVSDAVFGLCRTGGAGLGRGDPLYFSTDYTYWWKRRDPSI